MLSVTRMMLDLGMENVGHRDWFWWDYWTMVAIAIAMAAVSVDWGGLAVVDPVGSWGGRTTWAWWFCQF